MQQGSNSGSAFGSGSQPGPASGFGAFARPQTPSASTSSAPPNTFFRPQPQNASSSAFYSGFSNSQQQSSFGAPRPNNGGPRPQSQQAGFGTIRQPRLFGTESQSQSQQQAQPGTFNAARPFDPNQQSQAQQQQSSTFGNRPRPFTSRSTSSEGRPPNSNSFRGGRGGGTIRPIKPFASHASQNQQSASTEPGSYGNAGNGPGPSHAHASRPRPRPFANKSTTFNTQQPAQPPTFGSQPNGQASAPSSAFGAPTAFQSTGPAGPGPTASTPSFQSSSSLPTTQSTASPAQTASAFGSASSSGPASQTNFFGGASKPNPASAFGSTSTSSAFGSSTPPSSTSVFGGGGGGSTFGSAFSTSQQKPAPPPAVTLTAAAPPSSNNAPAASSSAPTSSFSNFLRKDRTGTSTPIEGSVPASDAGRGMEDEDELRKKRFEDAPKVGNRFLEMKGGREALRNAYIKSGVLPDPDKPTDLALAVKLVGTCQDMCPEFEREEREFQKELDPLEVYPGTDRVDPRIAVKIYRRPAAGRELPLPEDVRPPAVLKRTLDYLFHDLLPADPNDPRFTAVQGFLWNRTRAVRQDFIVQSEGGPIAVECHERIARYHILCLHWRGGPGAEGWSEQQELEQLRKTMRSLIEFYDDTRRKSSTSGQTSPNEAEFRAYNLLLHLRDPETLREAELLPGDIFRSPLVQTALNLRQLAQRSNNLEKRGQPRNTEGTLNFFSKFFAELRKPGVNYLMACLAENSFSSVRIGAIKAMSKAYMAQHRALPIETVQHVLGMDSAEQVMDMAKHLGIELEFEGGVPVGLKIHRSMTINEDKPLISPFSVSIVEAKRGSYTSADVVDGRASGASAALPSGSVRTQSSTQSFGKPTQATSAPSFGLKTQEHPGSAFGASTTSAFGQKQAEQDPSKPSIFGSEPPSKLSAAAPSFTPIAAAAGGSGSTSSPFSFGPSFSKKDDSVAKASTPTFGASSQATQEKQDRASNGAPLFGEKTPTTVSGAPDTQTKPSTLPSFSFGQPPANGAFAASSSGISQKREKESSSSTAPPFSFGAAPKTDGTSSKPAIPSFFATSSKAEDDKANSFTAAAASAKPTDAKEDKPLSSSNQQREQDLAAQAAAAAKADAEAQAQARRKEAARSLAVEHAFSKLSDEVIRSSAARTATTAVREEDARRRAASRDSLLNQIADTLWQRLAEEQADVSAERVSRVAAAEVFRSRSCAMRAWERWSEVLGERRDREQQRQRLETVRSEIRRRDILTRIQATPNREAKDVQEGKNSPIDQAFSIRRAVLTGERAPASLSRPKRKLGEDPPPGQVSTLRGDEELTERWTRVRRQRSQLWAEGSLLERLADHIEELLLHFRPADLDCLVVLYCGAPDGHVASSWLRVKFGFSPSASGRREEEDGRDVLEIDLADGSQLDLVDLTPTKGGGLEMEAALSDEDENGHVGLVIFETNPTAARAKTVLERGKILANDRKRLEELARSRIVKDSQLAPSLLVVAWGGVGLDAHQALGYANNVNDDDVEMADANPEGHEVQQPDLLSYLALDRSKSILSRTSAARSAPTSKESSSAISSTFKKVGVLELDDASASVESALAFLLPRVMPDLTPNPRLYLKGPRHSSLEDLVSGFYDQWSRASALFLDLLSSLPPALLSSSAPKVEALACKTLQIQTALANHILRTVLALSDTVLEEDNLAEEGGIILPLPQVSQSGATGPRLIEMALSQLDQLPEEKEEQRLHLRSRLLSSIHADGSMKDVLGIVNRKHIEELFGAAIGNLSEVWIGVKQGVEGEMVEAKDVLGRLCEAAVEEVAVETRALWAEYRKTTSGNVDNDMDMDDVSSSTGGRNGSDFVASQAGIGMEAIPVKASKANELRDLIARTKRFLDSPAS